MGGPMSVNDPLPWVAQSCALIRAAAAADLPVLGPLSGRPAHRQGARRRPSPENPVKEIGWGPVRVLDNADGACWFGDLAGFETFHWHGETFSIPPGATRLLESDHCANQAYALGKVLRHAMPRRDDGGDDPPVVPGRRRRNRRLEQPGGASRRKSCRTCMAPKVAALNAVADRIYARWIEGLNRD
jgi:hypothetical protein